MRMENWTKVPKGLDLEIKHDIQHYGVPAAIDQGVGAMAWRRLSRHQLMAPLQFSVISLSAVNELRCRGSHVPITALSFPD